MATKDDEDKELDEALEDDKPEDDKSDDKDAGKDNGDEGLAADMFEDDDNEGVDLDWEKFNEIRDAIKDADEDEYQLLLKEGEKFLKDANAPPSYLAVFKADAAIDRLKAQTEREG